MSCLHLNTKFKLCLSSKKKTSIHRFKLKYQKYGGSQSFLEKEHFEIECVKLTVNHSISMKYDESFRPIADEI